MKEQGKEKSSQNNLLLNQILPSQVKECSQFLSYYFFLFYSFLFLFISVFPLFTLCSLKATGEVVIGASQPVPSPDPSVWSRLAPFPGHGCSFPLP
jgi:hypothetical protein